MKIRTKKSLGQNFLVDKNILEKISNITKIDNRSVILEIGPGTGNLTNFLFSKNPKRIFAVEKDKNLSTFLKKKFNGKVNIINDDILNLNESKLSDEKMIVFGNLPFNISTKIITKWITENNYNQFWFKELILMFQKEVAERIISKVNSKNYGRLSIICNWKLDITKVFDVKAGCFYPKPKVESTILRFVPKSAYTKIKKPQNLEKITTIFFNERRKKIKKPFHKLFKDLTKTSKKLSINLNLRPQNLNIEDYLNIVKEYENLSN